jgi:hypothetical protein
MALCLLYLEMGSVSPSIFLEQVDELAKYLRHLGALQLPHWWSSLFQHANSQPN